MAIRFKSATMSACWSRSMGCCSNGSLGGKFLCFISDI